MATSSCYHDKSNIGKAGVEHSTATVDSASFSKKHHYARNYNFIVKSKTLPIIKQQPEERVNNLPTDTIQLRRHDHIVVVDIRLIGNDKIDSVWVQVARDQHTFGWIHESSLLPNVVPDDPISQFISTFSDTHILIFLIVISIISISYLLHKIMKKGSKIVHFNDIDSFYPALLAIIVATSATFYSCMQLFTPDTWRNFYFHPSLNPFSMPPILSVFICSVWAMVIVAIAAVDDIFHKLPFGQASLYLGGLVAICAANYIIFSITTLYYIGFPLLAVYIVSAVYLYLTHNANDYRCGKCGAKLKSKGICPHCGAINE